MLKNLTAETKKTGISAGLGGLDNKTMSRPGIE